MHSAHINTVVKIDESAHGWLVRSVSVIINHHFFNDLSDVSMAHLFYGNVDRFYDNHDCCGICNFPHRVGLPGCHYLA